MIIKIKNLRLKTIIGIYDFEQNFDREIIINAQIHTDFDKAKFSNDIKDTIDYDVIIKQIKALVASKKFQLIEGLAQEILQLIMQNEKVSKCTLELDKVGVVECVDSFSIILTEER